MLPTIISEYLAASDRRDQNAVVACFAADAVVFDEDREWRAETAIREWREIVATAFEYTVEVRAASALGPVDGVERHDVHMHLEGNFPGATVDLTNLFGLRADASRVCRSCRSSRRIVVVYRNGRSGPDVPGRSKRVGLWPRRHGQCCHNEHREGYGACPLI